MQLHSPNMPSSSLLHLSLLVGICGYLPSFYSFWICYLLFLPAVYHLRLVKPPRWGKHFNLERMFQLGERWPTKASLFFKWWGFVLTVSQTNTKTKTIVIMIKKTPPYQKDTSMCSSLLLFELYNVKTISVPNICLETSDSLCSLP